MKRTLLRRWSPKAETRELDHLCRAAVFRRDKGRCAHCGSERHLQWCHVYSRRYRSTRWDMDNSFSGCAGCHLWWHHCPMDAVRWFMEAFPERYKRLALRRRLRSKPDAAAIAVALRMELGE